MSSGVKVFFVDDDILLGNVVVGGLTKLGYVVNYQPSLIAIINAIEEFNPAIIILDIELGEKNGIDDTEDLRKLFPSIPIIYASSHTCHQYQRKGLYAGAVAYIKKPYDIEELSVYIDKFANVNNSEKLIIGNLLLDLDSRILKCTNSHQKVNLNKKEFELLKVLARNKGSVVLYEDIIKRHWKSEGTTQQVVFNYVHRLRNLLSLDSNVILETFPREGLKLYVRH